MIAKDNFLAFKAANYPSLSEDDAFERFAVSEVSLRSNKLGGAMVEDGLVGAKDDGGIDGFFVLLNGQELVQSDSARLTKRRNALDGLQTGLSLEVVIVQAKNETSWDTRKSRAPLRRFWQQTSLHQRCVRSRSTTMWSRRRSCSGSFERNSLRWSL